MHQMHNMVAITKGSEFFAATVDVEVNGETKRALILAPSELRDTLRDSNNSAQLEELSKQYPMMCFIDDSQKEIAGMLHELADAVFPVTSKETQPEEDVVLH